MGPGGVEAMTDGRADVWDWTGPRDGDIDGAGDIIAPPLPPERWPYAFATEHDAGCGLHYGGRFCDCECSVSEEDR